MKSKKDIEKRTPFVTENQKKLFSVKERNCDFFLCYGASRKERKKRGFNRKYRQILAWSKKSKKRFTSTISYLLNLNIRITDIVMIQWVRSTYFFVKKNINNSCPLKNENEKGSFVEVEKALYRI